VFVGHLGAALALKRIDRRVDTAVLILAALLPDLLLWMFVMLGIESVVIPPGFAPVSVSGRPSSRSLSLHRARLRRGSLLTRRLILARDVATRYKWARPNVKAGGSSMSPFPVAEPDPVVQAFLRLTTCNISDALDRLKLNGAARGILPLWPGCRKVAGRAMTIRLVKEGPVSAVHGTLRAITEAQPGAIMVVDHGGQTDVNSWGGIAAFTAAQRGLVGVVIDGVTRDVDEMKSLGFSAYAKGIIQQSIRGRCSFGGHGEEIRLAGVRVRAGDIVVADDNGVVVVPQDRLDETLAAAQECLADEERIRDWIASGVDPVEAHERVHYDRTGSAPPPGR
jgi:4-hydroxy-4-methyl-2-oxoglutarate aldolase